MDSGAKSLSDIPYDILYDIFLNHLDSPSIKNACVSGMFPDVCDNDQFWQTRLLRQFNIDTPIPGMTYRQTWFLYTQPVLYIFKFTAYARPIWVGDIHTQEGQEYILDNLDYVEHNHFAENNVNDDTGDEDHVDIQDHIQDHVVEDHVDNTSQDQVKEMFDDGFLELLNQSVKSIVDNLPVSTLDKLSVDIDNRRIVVTINGVLEQNRESLELALKESIERIILEGEQDPEMGTILLRYVRVDSSTSTRLNL